MGARAVGPDDKEAGAEVEAGAAAGGDGVYVQLGRLCFFGGGCGLVVWWLVKCARRFLRWSVGFKGASEGGRLVCAAYAAAAPRRRRPCPLLPRPARAPPPAARLDGDPRGGGLEHVLVRAGVSGHVGGCPAHVEADDLWGARGGGCPGLGPKAARRAFRPAGRR